MEFDESKLYTLVNADKVKIGSKGYYADDLKTLKERVNSHSGRWLGEVNKIYDEDNNRIKNENVSQSNLDNFMLDENVLSLREEIPNLQNKLLIIDWIAVGIDAFLGSLIYFVFAYIILGRGRSIGLYILKSELVDENGNKLAFKKCILYGFLKWLFVFPLGIITLFILPITMLYKVFYDDNHQTILDKKMKIECRILVKNISD